MIDAVDARRRARRRRAAAARLMVVDAVLLVVVYVATLYLRFELEVPRRYMDALVDYLPLAVGVHLIANWAFGLYRELWRHASVHQAVRAIVSCGAAGAALVTVSLVWDLGIPLSIRVFGPMMAALLLTALRFRGRVMARSTRRPDRSTRRSPGIRVLVIGAGEAGGSIIRDFQRNGAAGFRPVAILDDDGAKAGMSVAGVRVVGTLDDLSEVAQRHSVDQVLLAIPSARQETVRKIADACESADLPLRVLPRVEELLGGRISVRDVRDLSISDLVGRQPVKIDLGAVSRLLRGRRVLVTGAGGSIGSEIARQVATLDPSLLILLDRDETLLHDVAAGLADESVVSILADVRDRAWLETHFRRLRPEIVFHAAAHKHVPVLEEHPAEAFLTNVVGTKNVVEAAAGVGVMRLVLISTDKAVRPSSVMGASKRLAEHVVLSHAEANARFCAVRFGNVLGSRGSVVPTFARQIAAGGPVTVTDPSMTRFFLSIREAVQLVLQAAVLCEGREVFMLDMGQAVKIVDLANRMIRLAGRTPGTDIHIEFTGIRPGEKLVEELCAPGEVTEETDHPSVRRLSTTVMGRDRLDGLIDRLILDANACNDVAIARALRNLSVLEAEGADDTHPHA